MISTQFLFAGKAIFTVTNVLKGTRLTFKVTKPEERFNGSYFASVMKGSDNESDYRYVGMVNEQLQLRETKGSKFRAGSPEFEGLKLVLDLIAGRRPQTDKLAIQHAGKCGRCARLLTVPESIELGIGPDCAEAMGIPFPERKSEPAKRAAVITTPTGPAVALVGGGVHRTQSPEQAEAMAAAVNRFDAARAALPGPAFEMPDAPPVRRSLAAMAAQLEGSL